MLSLVRAEEKVKCLASDVPGKAQFFLAIFCFFFPSLLQKVLPLAVTLRCFRGYICNFPTFSENIFIAWQTKSAWLPAPRIHLFPRPVIFFLQIMLQLFFLHRHLNCSSFSGFALNASLANLSRSLQSEER